MEISQRGRCGSKSLPSAVTCGSESTTRLPSHIKNRQLGNFCQMNYAENPRGNRSMRYAAKNNPMPLGLSY